MKTINQKATFTACWKIEDTGKYANDECKHHIYRGDNHLSFDTMDIWKIEGNLLYDFKLALLTSIHDNRFMFKLGSVCTIDEENDVVLKFTLSSVNKVNNDLYEYEFSSGNNYIIHILLANCDSGYTIRLLDNAKDLTGKYLKVEFLYVEKPDEDKNNSK